MNTYNVAVCMPAAVASKVKAFGNLPLNWTAHARRALLDDRYGHLPPGSAPKTLKLDDWQLVEADAVRCRDGSAEVVKFVVRRRVDATRDLVLVIRPWDASASARMGTVVTAWINLTTDVHRTLDASKFATTW